MLRRIAGCLSLLLILALSAAPAWAGQSRSQAPAPSQVAGVLTRFWALVVQHLPFVVADPADNTPDRGADLDPWG